MTSNKWQVINNVEPLIHWIPASAGMTERGDSGFRRNDGVGVRRNDRAGQNTFRLSASRKRQAGRF